MMLLTAAACRASGNTTAFILAVAHHIEASFGKGSVACDVVRGKEGHAVVTEPEQAVSLDAVLIKILHTSFRCGGRDIPDAVETIVAATERTDIVYIVVIKNYFVTANGARQGYIVKVIFFKAFAVPMGGVLLIRSAALLCGAAAPSNVF